MHHRVSTTSRLIFTGAKSLSRPLPRLTNPETAAAVAAHEQGQQQLIFPSSSLLPTTAATMFPSTLRRLARPPSLTLLTPRSSRTYNSSSRSPSDGSSSSRGAPPPRILDSSRRNTTSGVPFVPSTGHLRPAGTSSPPLLPTSLADRWRKQISRYPPSLRCIARLIFLPPPLWHHHPLLPAMPHQKFGTWESRSWLPHRLPAVARCRSSVSSANVASR